MCGIIGIIGVQPVAPLLVEALKRLEYRGYDSAGVASLVNGRVDRRRAEGKLVNLEARLQDHPLSGTTGIGHTRWATHGVPSEINAHPHATERVAVVHNGIIENFQELRQELSAKGHAFSSDTDTEVVVHLLSQYLSEGASPEDATQRMLDRLEGAYALGIIFAGHHDLMIAARQGSPLVIGHGEGERYLGSDAMALAPLTRSLVYLEDGDWAVLRPEGVTMHDRNHQVVERPVTTSSLSGAMIGRGNYRHFMLKEIHEQPQVIGDTLNAFLNPAEGTVTLPLDGFDAATLSRLTLVACGTSYYAAMTAKYWIETVARLPVEVDVASEFRYRQGPMPEGGAALFISQSGETADTLAALRYAREQGQTILAVVNVEESSIARESDIVLRTNAGPEIGVASTKAFTTQLVVLAALALALGRARGTLAPADEAVLSHALAEVPSRAVEVLHREPLIEEMAQAVVHARDVLYLGRGSAYPIALEGALKLKEISYIHAEGYAAGEMKHGPIALIDENVPVVVLAPGDGLLDKTLSNIQEVAARGGRVLVLTDRRDRLPEGMAGVIDLPTVNPFVAPLLYAIPLQLLAYHVAVAKGTDVDQPRNLAKSVTVE